VDEDEGLTVGDLRQDLAKLDADLPVEVVHLGVPYIAPLPVQGVVPSVRVSSPSEYPVLQLVVGGQD
jgi:hypothetical protein